MKTAGIICECNPLHGGHLYLLERARAGGAEAVIAVMSGCFVQRGEAAVADPYARAEILVRAGFDAVVELPYPYAAASAEFFGAAGVEILDRLGVDELWFGSESGDLDALARCAEVAESDAFAQRYRECDKRTGSARAYFDCLREACADAAISFDPNDILALSYLRAIRKTGARLRPVTVRRVGCGYAETALSNTEFPSATALRRAWRKEGIDSILPLLPPACAEILARESETRRAPATLSAVSDLILGTLRLRDPAWLSGVAELDGGLSGRVSRAAWRATSYGELLELCASKTYPDARVRRGILFALTETRPADLRAPIAYARLLAANRVGCSYLSAVRKSTRIPVVTRRTDLPQSDAARAQLEREERAAALWSLTLPARESAEVLLRRTPVILDTEK
ncbi:MAG: nucleotidyltransferase family protein [Clostridia bacterium]|nr:nucleotidyltransferase family protein [Clostridia bacterium]